MKCPKCGYHSFDYLARCRKCDHDLTPFKGKYQLRSLIFPQRTPEGATAPSAVFVDPEPVAGAVPVASVAAASVDFDFMAEEPKSVVPPPVEVKLPPLGDRFAPELKEAVPFSWDDAPLESEAPAPVSVAAADAFDWSDAGAESLTEGEETDSEEVDPDDDFGLDLSWDPDLPSLDEASAMGEVSLEPLEADGLSDWDFEEEPFPLASQNLKAKQQEQPRDPFELRGPGADGPAPVSELREASLVLSVESEAARFGAPLDASPLAAGIPAAALVESPAFSSSPFAVRSTKGEPLPSVWSRGLAVGIDLLLLVGALLLFLLAGEQALAPMESNRLLPSSERLIQMAIPYFLVGFSLSYGYFTLFHFLIGQTPGKMLLRLRVETETGTSLDFSQAFLRSTGGLFALLPCGLGFLGLFFDRERRGWHDRLAGTRVVAAANVEAMGWETAE